MSEKRGRMVSQKVTEDHMVMDLGYGKKTEFYSKPKDRPSGYFGETNSTRKVRIYTAHFLSKAC